MHHFVHLSSRRLNCSSSPNTVFVLLQDLVASAVQLNFDHNGQVSANPTCLLFPSLTTRSRLRSLLYVLSKYVRKHHLVALAFLSVLLTDSLSLTDY